ncbi:MAG: Kdo2-lipid lauroyltransferase/acyltransferase [Candidatus Binatota bacterium]|jgi:KDO2-lipid IV(A) lauroyltransferase|nr:Kdo2-lipid lauroyltransferase/acyltransferase [Candidatus Binatota bacterium]
MPRRRSAFADRVEYLGVRIPVGLMRSLPFASAFRIGEALGDAAYLLARPQRRVALINLGIAFPEKSEAEKLVIIREGCRNFGRLAAEICHMSRVGPATVAETVAIDDRRYWDELNRASGTTGALVLTGHFGNWELCHHAAAAYGLPVHLIYRPFRNPYFDRFVGAERERAGTRTISKREAAREVIRALRAKAVVVVPFDQNATGRWGVFADFFSVPASTHPGLARFAMMSEVPVFPAFLVRRGDTPQHELRVQAPVEVIRGGNREADTVENTRRFNRVLEEAIRQYPEQWIWMHKRWRTRPPGEPPIY